MLGHTQASTTQIYARLSEDPARAALEAHAKNLEAKLHEAKEKLKEAEKQTTSGKLRFVK